MVYDEEELRAFKAAQETKTYKPAVDPTPTNPDRDEAALSKRVEGTQQLHLLTGLNTVADVLKAIREEQEVDRLTVPIHHKLTLSLVEASALSGISRQRRERRQNKESNFSVGCVGVARIYRFGTFSVTLPFVTATVTLPQLAVQPLPLEPVPLNVSCCRTRSRESPQLGR